MIKIKRAYEKAEKSDGTRVLIDRLWPRGVKKSSLRLHVWMKEVAPSTELREWFGHDPKRWTAFARKYQAELKKNREAVAALRKLARGNTLTLVYGAKDTEHNDAVVLKRVLSR